MNPTETQEHQVALRLSEVSDQSLEWLWPGRIALAKPALLDGDPGMGKSLLTLDVTARLTTARPLPDGTVPTRPVSVILVGSEDGLGDTVLPRLRAAGADLGRVHLFTGQARDAFGGRWPMFPEDCRLLTETVLETGAGLIVLDPLSAYLGGRSSGLGESAVRRALAPLTLLARQTRAALIWVRHLSKSRAGQAALYRGSGSIAIAGAARTAFLIGAAPDDAGLRVLACTKNNLATPPASLGFRIEANAAGQPVIAWTGPVPLSADELAAAPAAQGVALKRAKQFLQNLLQAGPRPAAEVRCLAEQAAINYGTLRRAKDAIPVKTKEIGMGHRGQWYWYLESAPDLPLITPEKHAQFLAEAAERGRRWAERLIEQHRLRLQGNTNDSPPAPSEPDA